MRELEELDREQRWIVAATLMAARAVMNETPYVGRQRAHERALSGRLGIWLSRQPAVRRLERREIRVDIEYDQMADGERKRLGDGYRRIDVLIHRRGLEGPNLLACEVKSDDGRPKAVEALDLEKLRFLTGQSGPFHYAVGLWLSLPRSREGAGYYAVIVNGKFLREGSRDAIHEIAAFV